MVGVDIGMASKITRVSRAGDHVGRKAEVFDTLCQRAMTCLWAIIPRDTCVRKVACTCIRLVRLIVFLG
ncbi:hypothetical protein GCM10012284_45140 [Mangrovihabitans endophyticus]|uniref:Uncharacterized protein n=1 Tax=Mangrovihabitans endophyticus TaxID=1751298 RepID=A0A8J3C1P5_9ACTN|nr:hypothetical protein GCM10012284_45140 [Mangrovihabitans endophyticus]